MAPVGPYAAEDMPRAGELVARSRPVNACVDAVYVLTVATFAERIAHIRRELARHSIAFEFVLAHDVGAGLAAEADVGPP